MVTLNGSPLDSNRAPFVPTISQPEDYITAQVPTLVTRIWTSFGFQTNKPIISLRFWGLTYAVDYDRFTAKTLQMHLTAHDPKRISKNL